PSEGPEIITKSRQKKERNESPHHNHQSPSTMPVHPSEENASGNKLAQDSTASTHDRHENKGEQVTPGGNVHAQAHKGNPGPVMADNLPTPESKEELRKRAEELNK
ncbi:hypothetical protein BDW02DRAFT_503717, partial [Decorospora gaudefroyi]